MSALQKQAIGLLSELSDDELEFIIQMITKFMSPAAAADKETAEGHKYKLGMFQGLEWCSPDYDLDEDNGEIAKLFEGIA